MISWSKLLSNLYVQRLAFTLIGIDLEARPNASIINRLWLLLIFLIPSVYQWSCVLAYILLAEQTIAETTWTLMVLFQTTLSLLKMITVVYNARELIQLNVDINNLLNGEFVSSKARSIWLEGNRRTQGQSLAYAVSVFFSVISFLMMSLAITALSSFKYGEFTPTASVNTMTPYDQSKPLYFTLEYLLVAANVFISAASSIGVDTLFLWYVSNISGHFRIVTQQLEELAEVFDNIDGNFYSRELHENNVLLLHFEHYLKKMLHHHKTTLNLSERFAETFRELILWEVSINCLILCSIVCQYMMSENLQQDFIFLNNFGITIFVQLMIYCFGSDILTDESHKISYALYDRLPWYRMPIHLQKLLLLLPVKRTQQDMILTGYFFRLDRPLLIMIIRTAFSGATIMSVLQDRQSII